MKNLFGFIVVFIFVLVFLIQSSAFALTEERDSDSRTLTILDYIDDYVNVPLGAVDWRVFGATNAVAIETKTEDGYDLSYQKPEFSQKMESLNGQNITVKGYMFPLDEAEKQKLFLFGPFPASCPYHYHVGPSLIIEVHADQNPVKFDFTPVVISGELELVYNDPEYSTFYRLKNAKQVK